MTGVATDRNIRNNRRRDTAKCLQRLRELPRPRSRARVLHGHTRHPRTAPAGRAPPRAEIRLRRASFDGPRRGWP